MPEDTEGSVFEEIERRQKTAGLFWRSVPSLRHSCVSCCVTVVANTDCRSMPQTNALDLVKSGI